MPARGIIDSGAEITIVGGELFRRIAAVARLKKSQLKQTDKIPKTYDRKTFALDGRMDLDVSFGEMTMQMPVYIKMDAPEQLLLGEGVCRQLNIITYHPSVFGKGGRKRDEEHSMKKTTRADGTRPQSSESKTKSQVISNDAEDGGRCSKEQHSHANVPDVTGVTTSATQTTVDDEDCDAMVPMVCVRLVTSLRVRPHQSVLAQVKTDTDHLNSDPLLLQYQKEVEESLGVRVGDSLAQTVPAMYSLSTHPDSPDICRLVSSWEKLSRRQL